MAMILLMEAIFVGTSFETFQVSMLFYVACGGIGWLRLQRRPAERLRTNTGLHAATHTETTKIASTQNAAKKIGRRGTSRLLLTSALFLIASAAVFTWRLSIYDVSTANPVALIVDAGAHIALTCSLLIWVGRGWRGQLMLLSLGLIVALLCVAGGGGGQSYVAQLAIGLLSGVAFLFASQQILRYREFTRLSRPRDGVGTSVENNFSGPPQPAISTRSFADNMPLICAVLVMSAILTATSVISSTTNRALPAIQENLRAQLKDTFTAVANRSTIGTANYVTGSKLGAVRRHMLGNPDDVALRGRSVTAPGYLRGTTFANYSLTRWIRSSKRAEQMGGDVSATQTLNPAERAKVSLQQYSPAGRNRFRISDEPEQPLIKVEIQNDPLKGSVYFSMLGSRWVEAKSDRIQVGDDRIVVHGIDATQPYVWGASNTAGPESLPTWQRDLLLGVPYTMSRQLRELAVRLCGDASSPREKAARVSDYFQSNFQYSMDKPPRRYGKDPLEWFLESEHPAHCEYFASSTALILRSAGVPTRYVTGYVMDEPDDEIGSWKACNRDAHAWVEAYDDESRSWFSVESTPGRQYSTVSMQAADSLDSVGIESMLADAGAGTRSSLERLWAWVTARRATDTLIVILRFAQLPLFLVLAGALIYRYRKSIAEQGDASELKSRAVLRRADKLLRKYSLVRRPNETLHRFAARIESIADSESSPVNAIAGIEQSDLDTGPQPTNTARRVLATSDRERLIAAADWYREFAVSRFSAEPAVVPTDLKRVISGLQAS